jgi:hypothetical protein
VNARDRLVRARIVLCVVAFLIGSLIGVGIGHLLVVVLR